MTSHLHRLEGCAPEPLAHYLKGLGVLRIVAEQADPHARGAWRDGCFVLMTRLDRDELERFFLERYAPLPLISPWNKGSGLLAATDQAVAALVRSTAPRFEAFRRGIEAAKLLSKGLVEADTKVRAIKDEANKLKDLRVREELRADPVYKRRLAAANRVFKRLKDGDVIPPCRLAWRGPHQRWLDAVLVIRDDGKVDYPGLWGKGGGDGRLDFTNNGMQRLGELFDLASPNGAARPGTAERLRAALWRSTSVESQRAAPVGQFLPASAGGANASTAPSGGASVNEWDFALMLEAAPLFATAATRRLQANVSSAGSAPFAVRSRAVGYGSASIAEESMEGEQWMPLWGQLATLGEVSRLLAEGRAQIGNKVADKPVDLARAIAQLGVERGLTGFQRYGYLERNGQSNLAVSLGRIGAGQAHPRAHLVSDHLAMWLERLHQKARAKNAPRSLALAERRVADAVFGAVTRPDEPLAWQSVLLALGGVEDLLVAGSPVQAGPIPWLESEWLEAADDNSPELRLAASLAWAGAGTTPKSGPTTRVVDGMRAHVLPLDRRGNLVARDGKVASDPRVFSPATPALVALGSIVQRRLIEAEAGARRRLPIAGYLGREAALSDLVAFVAGQVDVERCWRLARALMAVRPGRVALAPAARDGLPDDLWIALRLSMLPFPLPLAEDGTIMRTSRAATGGKSVPADPAIVRRLLAGDASAAIRLALRRLSAAGLVPPLELATADEATTARMVASLAFPISRRGAATLCRRFTRLSLQESAHVR